MLLYDSIKSDVPLGFVHGSLPLSLRLRGRRRSGIAEKFADFESERLRHVVKRVGFWHAPRVNSQHPRNERRRHSHCFCKGCPRHSTFFEDAVHGCHEANGGRIFRCHKGNYTAVNPRVQPFLGILEFFRN